MASDVGERDEERLELEELEAQADPGGNTVNGDALPTTAAVLIKALKSLGRCRYTCVPGVGFGSTVRIMKCKPTDGRATITKYLAGGCCPAPGMTRCSHNRESVCRRNLTWASSWKECGITYKKCTLKMRRRSRLDFEKKKYIAHQKEVCFFKLQADAIEEGGLPRQGRHPRCCRRCVNGKWTSPTCVYKTPIA